MKTILKTSYNQDINLFEDKTEMFWGAMGLFLLLLAPLFLDIFYIGELSLILIYAITGLGLMLLVGYTGLVSLGHAAFLGIGAYTDAVLLAQGVPFIIAFVMAGIVAAIAGILLALPVLRMTGLYLAIATLAFAIIIEEVFVHWESLTGGFRGMNVEPPSFFGVVLWEPSELYYLCLAVLLLVLFAVLNLLRTPTGRALIAIRDSPVSAQSLGIHPAKYKVISFALSAGITGLAGALMGHRTEYLSPDSFNILLSIQLLMMVVVGGLGSVQGALWGAVFVGFLPQGLALLRDFLPSGIAQLPGLEAGVFGLILVLFIIFEPLGIHGRWRKIRHYWELFPLYRKRSFERQKSYLKTERFQ